VDQLLQHPLHTGGAHLGSMSVVGAVCCARGGTLSWARCEYKVLTESINGKPYLTIRGFSLCQIDQLQIIGRICDRFSRRLWTDI
jgi:hypothetical protein